MKNAATPRQVLTRVPTARLRAWASSDDRCATRDGVGRRGAHHGEVGGDLLVALDQLVALGAGQPAAVASCSSRCHSCACASTYASRSTPLSLDWP